MTSIDASPWRDDPDRIRPTVLILGGLITSPPLYGPFRSRLLGHGASAVVVAPIWLPDWLLAVPRGLGPIVTRAGRALIRASQISWSASGGAPVLIVGHSAGGIVARLLTSPEPFEGRRLGGSERIGAIVTLGSPHQLAGLGDGGIARRELGRRAVDFAERVVPGAAYAPRVGYVSVASRAVLGSATGIGPQRIALLSYRSLLGGGLEQAETPGDGVVPVSCALLPGSRHVVLDGAGHTVLGRPRWYGSEGVVDDWWPFALTAWRSALRARLDRRG